MLVGVAFINSQISSRKKIIINNITQYLCRIDCHADKQESRPCCSWYGSGRKVRKYQTKNSIVKKQTNNMHLYYASQILNRATKLNELVYNAQKFNISIIAIQEHRLIHEEPLKHHSLGDNWLLITSSATRNTTKAAIGGVGILLNPHAKLALESIETISERTMIEAFNGNPKCTVISTYSPTNVTSENAIKEYYSELTTLVHQVPKHNILFLCGDMNAQDYHQTNNRNGELLCELQHSTNLINLCT